MLPTDRDPPASDITPGADSAEQDDESSQAQTVAEDATGHSTAGIGLGESEKVSSGDDTDDVQDLVDHMKQMDRSGVIDMGAFRGERNDDEEEDRYGPGPDKD